MARAILQKAGVWLLSFALASVFLLPSVVRAAEDEQCGKLQTQFEDFTGTQSPDLFSANCYSPGGLVNRGVAISFMFAAGIAVLFIIIGGFQYMVSGEVVTGEGDKKSSKLQGKKTIRWAVMGLIIILLAWTIVTVVSQVIVGN